MVASDDPEVGGLDPDVGGLDLHVVGINPDDDVGLDADGRGVYTFSNLNDGWYGIEDDDCDDPDLDPDGRCAVEADDDKYKEVDENDEHKAGRQGRHFSRSLLVCSPFALK